MSEKRTYAILITAIIAAGFLVGLIVFLPAGTLFWLEGWIYLLMLMGFFLIMIIYFQKNNPDLLKSRMKAKPRERWDLIVTVVLSLAFFAVYMLPGLEAVRFNWTQMHPILEIIGFVLFVLSLVTLFIVMKENTFATKAVQVDEKTKVITTGPYKYVRHPMYVGFTLLIISTCFALGSFFALIPAGVFVACIFVRTHFEDKMLHEELEGYKEYAQKTKYRIIPGIW